MPEQDWLVLGEKILPSQKDAVRKIHVKVLGKEKSGDILLQVSGRWVGKGEKLDPIQIRGFDFFRSMERASMYGLETPTISGGAIRFAVAGEAKTINRLLSGLRLLNVPYRVNKLGRLKARTESMMNDLTLQQSRVLKLAHTMGYYDIPRRTNTENLARILGMDKATVGEHLRRAEKHIFDKLIEAR